MPDRDIVDAIDELVDTQMAGGEPETGYDYGDPTYPDCPHPWCTETWHGLKITKRMLQMRWNGYLDEDYRYNEDTTEVLCPGSDFVGEFTPPDTARIVGTSRTAPSVNELLLAAYSMFGDLAMIGGLPDVWNVPDGPMHSEAWLADSPRWWRCDDTTGLHAHLVDLMRDELADFHTPDRVGFWNHRWVLVIGREEIELHADRQNPTNWNRGVAPGGRPWLEIYTSTPPSAGVWRPMDGVLDAAGVATLRNAQYAMYVAVGTWVRQDIIANELRTQMQQAVREQFPGVVIHRAELTVEYESPPTPENVMAGRRRVTGRWAPKPVGGVMEGGHAHGVLVGRNVERVETVAPPRFTLDDWRNPSATTDLNRVTYERAAYDTVTRRYVYRPRQPARSATINVPSSDGTGWQELGTIAGSINLHPRVPEDLEPLRFGDGRTRTIPVTLTDVNPDLVRLLQGDNNPADEPAEGDQAA